MSQMNQTLGPATSAPDRGPLRSLRAWIQGSESARGYGLMLPTVLLLLVAMVAPFTYLVSLSLWTQSGLHIDRSALSFDNYVVLWEKRIYPLILWRSIKISAMVTLATVLLAYPAAYFIAFGVKRNKFIWLILITIPFWTSYLLRVFAWKLVLGYNGVINSSLMNVGLIDQPLTFMLYNEAAVIITLAHAWAAFAILPIYVSLEKIDRSLLDAAADLGEGPVMSFLRVTLPLSLPGVISASLLVFIPTVGDYVTPKLVGGNTGIMVGNLIQTLFGRGNNWPLGAALSIFSMLTITLLVCAFLVVVHNAKRRLS